MNAKILRGLTGAALVLGLCGAAVAAETLNLDDMLGLPAAEKPAASASSGVFGLPTVEGPDFETALASAAADHAQGTKSIKTPSGIGFVATGVGPYQKDPDINRARLAKRQAYVVAFMDARRELSRCLKGLSVEQKQELCDMSERDVDASTKINDHVTSAEKIDETINTILSGYTTYEVYDDEAGTVYVSIVSSPTTRGFRASSPAVLDADVLADGVNQVMKDIKKQVTPPSGARLVNVPGTSSTAIVSFGSDIVLQDPDGTFNSRQKLVAQRRARARADAAMIAFLKGETFVWNYGLDNSDEFKSSNYEKIVQNGVEVDRMLDARRNEFLSTTKDHESSTAAASGTLPIGINSRSWTDDGWAFSVNLYTPELTAWTTREALRAAEPVPPPPPPAAPSAAAPVPAEKPASSAEYRDLKFDEFAVDTVDWERGFVEISGQCAMPQGKSGAKGRLLARRGAMTDMQRKFVEYLKGALVDSTTNVADFEAGSDRVNSEMHGHLQNVAVSAENWDGKIYTVTGRMQLADVQKFLEGMREYLKEAK